MARATHSVWCGRAPSPCGRRPKSAPRGLIRRNLSRAASTRRPAASSVGPFWGGAGRRIFAGGRA
eukprot:4218353-Lingulodinium_polyedra.AAC.1